MMRKPSLIAALMAPLLLAGAEPAMAQASPGKIKGCFSKAEETAEQMVRLGLRLREGAKGCNGSPWNKGTKAAWDDVDKRFGPQFANQTQIRQKAFQREFQDDAVNRLEFWNGRIVMYYRNYPLSAEYCQGIKDLLEQMQKRGWRWFTTQASKARDEVKMDYTACGK